MKRVAIVYICTGPYIAYWKDFFDSFEQKFMPGWEKHYYVFTDGQEVYQKDNERVHLKYQSTMPWPLITLLKFQIVLSVENELKKYDFIYMSNANVICEQIVEEEEILPRTDLGEYMVFTHHAASYIQKKYKTPVFCEYERDSKSLAYVPYNKGKQYVYGNMFGGYATNFLKFARELSWRINEDLKVGKIAKWHDESHVNHYVVTHADYRMINTGYCYPVGFEVPFERKIVGVPKATVFDVDEFKGYYQLPKQSFCKRCFLKVYKPWKYICIPILFSARDCVLRRKPAK